MSDYIDREAAIDAICEHGTVLERRGITVLAVANYKQATIDLLESLPSVQPQSMRGRWETVEGWDGDEVYRCSACGEEYVLIDGTPKENGYHFCPNCGADMRGTE